MAIPIPFDWDSIHCHVCRTLVAFNEDVCAAVPPAGVFKRVFNVINQNVHQPEIGMTVVNTYCAECGTMLGWKYIDVAIPHVLYKEGRFLLRLDTLVDSNDDEENADQDRDANDQDLGANDQNGNQDLDADGQNADQYGDANEQVPNEQESGANEQNVDQDGGGNQQVPNEQESGANEQNVDQDGGGNQQVPNEQDVGANNEQFADQDGGGNEQTDDDEDGGRPTKRRKI